MAEKESITAAAVQMDAKLGDVAGNLEKAERLAGEAFSKGAKWVMLPEFFTSPVGYHDCLKNVALPPDGPAASMMIGLAKRNGGYVGGSFITAENGNAYNRYVLAGPNGLLGTHDKDQPTMWENAYYVGGSDDGIIETEYGPVGAAVCWELIRTRTAGRLRGKVGLVAGGSCWWSVPDVYAGRPVVKIFDLENRKIMMETPARFARMVGAPVIHAAHCARFVCKTPYAPIMPFSSYYLGEAQIVAADGSILARRTFEEGEGIITASVKIGATGPADDIPGGFWIPDMPLWMRGAWGYQNFHGRRQYARAKKSGGFNWQKPGWNKG